MPSTSRSHVLRFGLLGAWCAGVWLLSAQSDPERVVGFRLELPDWALHGLEYAVGGWLARQAAEPLWPRRGTWAAFVFCAAWGALDEWHQSFVPGRFPGLADLAADCVGAGLGCAAHALGRRRAS